MVPQKLTRWEAPHVTGSASEVPPSPLFLRASFIFPLSILFLPSLPYSAPDSFSSPHSSFTCPLIQILLPLAPSLPLTLLSIQSWSTDYTVTFCFILSQTPEGKPFQDISQQSNTPTLSLSWTASTQASSPDTQHTPTHTHTHPGFFLHRTCVLNLPRLRFYHTETFFFFFLCVPPPNKPSSDIRKQGWDLLGAGNNAIHI